MDKKPTRPGDPNSPAKALMDLATMDEDELRRFQAKRSKAQGKPRKPHAKGS